MSATLIAGSSSLSGLRVAIAIPDRRRRDALVREVAAFGHTIEDDADQADVLLTEIGGDGRPPARHADTPTVLLSDGGTDGYDAEGVLNRAASATAIDAAVRAVAAGLIVREPNHGFDAHDGSIGGAAPGAPKRNWVAVADDDPAHPLLTPREVDILAAVGEGLSNKAVARKLGISAHTVKFHMEAIFDKLDAATRAEAVAKGLRRGLIEV